jgi:tyramine---L-glutamate ligase
MRIFVYEFLTGGGAWSNEQPLPDSLRAEGEAMLRAVAADLADLQGMHVVTTRDVRLPPLPVASVEVMPVASSAEERATIAQLAKTANWTLLIAPETGGALLDRSRIAEQVGGRLLSPSSDVIEIASSKHATARRLAEVGIQVPRGELITGTDDEWLTSLRFPVVVKPDGECGSCGIRVIHNRGELLFTARDERSHSLRVEEFAPGLPASVAVLCGPGGHRALPACEQVLSAEEQFRYLGGRLPLSSKLNRRARQLALRSVGALPQPQGYIGVDLVLGEADDGSGDHVIEINPRLTTSYVGLRALARSNLAAAMLAVACGKTPDLSFHDEQLEFTADGTISPVPCSVSPVSSPLSPAL